MSTSNLYDVVLVCEVNFYTIFASFYDYEKSWHCYALTYMKCIILNLKYDIYNYDTCDEKYKRHMTVTVAKEWSYNNCEKE